MRVKLGEMNIEFYVISTGYIKRATKFGRKVKAPSLETKTILVQVTAVQKVCTVIDLSYVMRVSRGNAV